MKRNSKGEANEIRMELKYCERCGGLWVRECGAGMVYCGSCQEKVADLPIPKKKPGRVRLPVGQQTLVEEYDLGHAEDDAHKDQRAMGGVA